MLDWFFLGIFGDSTGFLKSIEEAEKTMKERIGSRKRSHLEEVFESVSALSRMHAECCFEVECAAIEGDEEATLRLLSQRNLPGVGNMIESLLAEVLRSRIASVNRLRRACLAFHLGWNIRLGFRRILVG